MLYAFLASGIVLALIAGLKLLEQAGGARMYVALRERADDALLAGIASFENKLRQKLDEIRREVILKSLHIVTYLALIGVRSVEDRLQRLTRFFRGLRRAKAPREGTPVLTRMLGEDTHSADERTE